MKTACVMYTKPCNPLQNTNTESSGCPTRHGVVARDGSSSDSPVVGSYCDSRTPLPVTSQGNALTLQAFSQATSGQGVSFRAVYSVETASCGGELTSETGLVASPGFPNNYPDASECIWTIGSPGAGLGSQVSLTFSQVLTIALFSSLFVPKKTTNKVAGILN